MRPAMIGASMVVAGFAGLGTMVVAEVVEEAPHPLVVLVVLTAFFAACVSVGVLLGLGTEEDQP